MSQQEDITNTKQTEWTINYNGNIEVLHVQVRLCSFWFFKIYLNTNVNQPGIIISYKSDLYFIHQSILRRHAFGQSMKLMRCYSLTPKWFPCPRSRLDVRYLSRHYRISCRRWHSSIQPSSGVTSFIVAPVLVSLFTSRGVLCYVNLHGAQTLTVSTVATIVLMTRVGHLIQFVHFWFPGFLVRVCHFGWRHCFLPWCQTRSYRHPRTLSRRTTMT